MKNIQRIIFTLFILNSFISIAQVPVEIIRTENPPVIDGVIEQDIWNNATDLEINNTAKNDFKVLVTYDRSHLYVAFLNLTNSEGIRHHAEVLINTQSDVQTWNEQCYWFHSSHSNCSSEGGYYVWSNCQSTPYGWRANSFPLKQDQNAIEFKISWAKLKMNPNNLESLRFAVKISDSGNHDFYWPAEATIENPESWGLVSF